MSGLVWTRPAWVLFLISATSTCCYKKQRAFFSPLKVSSSNWTVSSAADVTQVSAFFGAVMGLLFMLECFQSDVMLFWCLQLIISFSADVIKRNAPRTLSHQIKTGRGTAYLCGLAGTSGTIFFLYHYWGGWGSWDLTGSSCRTWWPPLPHYNFFWFPLLVSQINWDDPPPRPYQKKKKKGREEK